MVVWRFWASAASKASACNSISHANNFDLARFVCFDYLTIAPSHPRASAILE